MSDSRVRCRKLMKGRPASSRHTTSRSLQGETLSLELREAFIFVYYQGRMDGIKEIRDLPAD